MRGSQKQIFLKIDNMRNFNDFQQFFELLYSGFRSASKKNGNQIHHTQQIALGNYLNAHCYSFLPFGSLFGIPDLSLFLGLLKSALQNLRDFFYNFQTTEITQKFLFPDKKKCSNDIEMLHF